MLNSAQQIIREFITALSVLALVFLSFGHQPPSANYNDVAVDAYQVAVLSFCGDGPANGDHSLHGPCHACRSYIAALPPAPCDAEPAYATSLAIVHHNADDTIRVSHVTERYNPRAPPITA